MSEHNTRTLPPVLPAPQDLDDFIFHWESNIPPVSDVKGSTHARFPSGKPYDSACLPDRIEENGERCCIRSLFFYPYRPLAAYETC